MKDRHNDNSGPPVDLRRRAETAWRDRQVEPGPAADLNDVRRLVHELQIHQIELEMQNDELLAAQSELEDSRAHYRELFEFAPVGYVTLDRDAIVRDANAKAEEILGTGRRRIIGQFFARCLAPESGPRFYQYWTELKTREAAGTEGAAPSVIELCVRPGKGPQVWIELQTAGPLAAAAQSWRCAITDITNRRADEMRLREYAAQLKNKNDELVKLNSELDEFAFAASHDLQEPLRTVKIYSEFLVSRLRLPPDSEEAQFAGYVGNAAARMQQLIRDLLAYSRVVHRDEELAGAVDLNRALDEAVSVLGPRLEETGAALVRGPLPIVAGDPQQLALVFQNLVSNALKYRRPDVPPRVEVRSIQTGREWVVSVRDNGIGFHPSHAVRIFGLFKRLHNTYPGTGVGLAISKRIVERYGGRMWAESAGEGEGAAFFFSLPEPQTAEPTPPAPVTADRPAR